MIRFFFLFFLGFSLLPGCGDDDAPPAAPTATATSSPLAPATPTLSLIPTGTATAIPSATATASHSPTATDTARPTDTPADTPTPTDTPTVTPTATDEPAPTPSETPVVTNCCGNAEVDEGEECDDGDQEGGDGCAANCTLERELPLALLGEVQVPTLIFDLSLPLSSAEVFRIGQPTGGGFQPCRDGPTFAAGEIPLAQGAGDAVYEPVEVPGLVCACIRPTAPKRCGRPRIGNQEASCRPGPDCTADDSVCDEEGACRFAHGEDNAASGIIGCDGSADVDYVVRPSQTPAVPASCARTGGAAPPGSAFLFVSRQIGTIQGDCSLDEANPDKGPDGLPCTDDDPPVVRGQRQTVPLTTGAATFIASLGLHSAAIGAGEACGPAPCPEVYTGAPFACAALAEEPPRAGDFRLCSVAAAAATDGEAGDVAIGGCVAQP